MAQGLKTPSARSPDLCGAGSSPWPPGGTGPLVSAPGLFARLPKTGVENGVLSWGGGINVPAASGLCPRPAGTLLAGSVP